MSVYIQKAGCDLFRMYLLSRTQRCYNHNVHITHLHEQLPCLSVSGIYGIVICGRCVGLGDFPLIGHYTSTNNFFLLLIQSRLLQIKAISNYKLDHKKRREA